MIIKISPILAVPDGKYKDSFIEALREGFSLGSSPALSKEKIDAIEADFQSYINKLLDSSGKIKCPDGNIYNKVPSDYYFLVSKDIFIGAISLRHHLNEFLVKFGGHIGYSVRPKFRCLRYGSLMLKLCLEKARELGLERALITCNEDNIGSYKIIEANGGVLEDIVKYDWHDKNLKRYWIEL